MINAQNASRLFCREAFLTTWITTDTHGTGGNGGSKEGTRVTEYEWKRYKTARNVRKKFSVPVWDHEAASPRPVTRTRKPTEIVGFQRVFYENCSFFENAILCLLRRRICAADSANWNLDYKGLCKYTISTSCIPLSQIGWS